MQNHNAGTPELLKAVERTAKEFVRQQAGSLDLSGVEDLRTALVKRLTPLVRRAEDKAGINTFVDSLKGKTAEEVAYLLELLRFKIAYIAEKATHSKGENAV